MAYLESFIDICQGSQVRSCSLQCGELNGTGLKTCLSRNLICQHNSSAGHLLVPECIHRNFLTKLTYISAVCHLNALGHSDHYGRLGSSQLFHILHEFIDIKYSLRKINCITSAAVIPFGKGCRCR